MAIETERKFLVNKDRWNGVKTEGKLYRQGYLFRGEETTIRVRLVEGDKGYLTIKGKATGASRSEYEYPIPLNDAEEMLRSFCDAIVSKKRHTVVVAGKLWEVDEFLDANEGLLLAELELENEHETFALPDWVENEVTDDPRYYNSQLSLHPFKDWKE